MTERHELIEQVLHLSMGYADARALWVVAELGIADLIGDGERSVEELASSANVLAEPLYRVLRLAASCGVVRETDPRRFALAALGRLLRSDDPDSMRDWVRMTGGPIHDSFRDVLDSVRTGAPVFEQVLGAPLYQYMGKHPAHAATFNAAMVTYSSHAARALVETYDFSRVRKVVDVGAGPGAMLMGVLETNPHLTGTLFDLPHVADLARREISRKGLAGRCEIAGGDFMEAVPAGADCYVLSSIIHNWDDARAVRILRNCRQAMAPGGRVLVVEMLIPEGNDRHFGKPTDMVMLVALGGSERTRAQYASLMSQAGLELTAVVPSPYRMCVLEARAA